MKVYIAGKITGDDNYKSRFEYAEKSLHKQGFTVLNPAVLPEGMRPADYMRLCFSMIDCADIVAFLPNYENSKGATIEFDLCQYIGKQTMFLESMRFYNPQGGGNEPEEGEEENASD